MSYLEFCDIQRTAVLPNNQKLHKNILLLGPARGRGTARKEGEGPGDGTGGGKHIRVLTNHLEKKQTLMSPELSIDLWTFNDTVINILCLQKVFFETRYNTNINIQDDNCMIMVTVFVTYIKKNNNLQK